MLDTLSNLKAFCLPLSLQAKDGYDGLLTAIGAGVASRFESFCNRKFGRVSGDTYETNGDRQIIVLPRYPLESVAQVEFRYRHGDDWTVESDAIASVDEESGLVTLCYALGDYQSRIRITYTGGYWYDAVGGQSQPVGSAALPEHILLHWKAQCKHLFDSLDVTSSSLSEKQWVSRIASYDLAPEVKAALQPERRLA